jgi:NifB/MoaA-like Fe-S oxidoreductase
VYPSDEWYLVSGRDVPPGSEYDQFPQVENGVGMVRKLLDEWDALKGDLPGSRLGSATLVCGTLIAPVLARIVEEANALVGARWELVPVTNRFFGPVTTVSGLLTGQDVVAALQNRSPGDVILLPRAMFTSRYGAGTAAPCMTLDDISLAEISAQLGVRVEMAGALTDVLALL